MRNLELSRWWPILLAGSIAACAPAPQKTFDAESGEDAPSSPDADVTDDTSIDATGDIVPPDISPDTTDTPDDDTEDTPFDASPDTPFEDICEPECTDALCGPDGCGGSCGDCPESNECVDGECLVTCGDALEICDDPGSTRCADTANILETCEDGGDGCLLWTPSTCPANTVCDEGACITPCEPSCPEAAVCGDDGCGGNCGLCPDATVCVEGGCLEDQDSDGYPVGVDCNESNPLQNPGMPEIPYDGQDNDCDAETPDDDADADGYAAIGMGGDDCADDDPSIHPGALDMVGDNIDQDCDLKDGVDQDGDGSASIASGGTDCDDTDPHIHPGVPDVGGNEIDENCDGVDGYAPIPEPDLTLCVIAGTAGTAMTCPLRLVRNEMADPPAAALQMNLLWDPSLVALTAVFHVPCPATWDCLLPPLIGAGADLLPSGHAMTAYPGTLPSAPGQGYLSMILHHPTNPPSLLTDVYLDGGEPSSAPELFWLEFSLLTDISDGEPATILVNQPLGVSATMVELTTIADEGFVITAGVQ
jgi:hypothetical protein